jgi:transcriptional regulator with XRE-family HTH domain
MEINERIKTLRTEKNLSQTQVAESLNISQSSYFQLEKGNTELSINRLQQIAQALDVELVELLGLDAPVVDESKIKELEKEIEKLKGKNAELDHIIGSTSAYLNSTLEHFAVKIANENNFKIKHSISVKSKVDGEWKIIGFYQSKKEAIEEFNKLNSFGEFADFWFREVLSDIDRRKVYEIMSNSKEYKKAFLVLLGTNMIDDEIAMRFYVQLLHGNNNG